MTLRFQISFLASLAAGIFCANADAVDFEKEILPIFKEHCIECHGPDKQKSEFRIDQRAIMLTGGDSGIAALVPGDPKASYLIEVINGSDPDMIMPPKDDLLTKEQVALFEKWIEEGANWPGQMDAKVELTSDLWSLKPVEKQTVPENDAKSPIDAFLRKKLAESGIEPNAPANARSLIQRASITLTGLPPKPERVKRFEGDFVKNADEAYTTLVDELLASEHFGERWAQHWLDVIRWAETNGSEANLYRKNAWIYRDYVIRAFNEDVPYEQFVREQLAGDQLGAGEATGFLVAGPHVPAATVGREPSAIRQARADRMDEIMQTVGASMLGMTVSCARCHNHKFDPISIKDYYSLTAVFQGVEFGGRWPEYSDDHPRQERAKQLRSKMFTERSTLRTEVGQWMEDWGGFAEFHFPKVETKALRIEFAKPNFGIDELQVYGPADYSENLALASAGTELVTDEKFTKPGNGVSIANDGVFGTMAWRTQKLKDSKEMPWVEVRFKDSHEVNKFRFSSNREYFFETDYLDKNSKFFAPSFKISALQEDGSWKEVGKTGWAKALLQKNPAAKKAHQQLQENIALLSEEGPRHSFVGAFKAKPGVTQVMHRGSPENLRDEVMPAGFAIMKGDLGLTSTTPDSERRAKFAEWVVNQENPLTSRVMVNRIWHHIFGTGIVPTPSDFGKAGAMPTHPELLDWLAIDFVKNGWSMKKMIRQIVLTDAFRRSSLPDETKLAADANSMLLWRFPPQRVSAEVIRDGILQASGKLNPEVGGRSFRIHNVKKTYAQWEVVDNHGSETWRRMIYQERMRRVDDKMFTAFDFPDCGQVRAKRPVSTTPLQALNLMNSDFVVEQSKLIAERATVDAPNAAINRLFELILARDSSDEERQVCEAISESNGLEIVARSLINSNEFAFMP